MKRDIAIIGMSGRFPKSPDIQSFWKNLVNGQELVHFFTDEELEARGVKKAELKNPNYVKAASFIEGADAFDYPFFRYTKEEAMIMNPQTRLMHQLVWQALEDAGCDSDRYRKKIGIFLGANKDLNWSFYSNFLDKKNVDELTSSKLSNPNFIASLISYKMNFRGPCYFIDTACSTSLSTAHLACRSLLLNECGIAVVGGVRVLSFEDNGYLYQEGSIMSKDGHCRSFDSRSTGTMGCDGAGVVILKRLESALQDQDYIYAVIKASAMNNDGSLKGGYTMPSVQGQSDCIKLAQKIAGVSSSDITYVETHGTGTKIGDPIEIESLNIAFERNTQHQCAIGSVKSNMGHADEAAGIAGLLKTALAINHKVIPPSLCYDSPNPTIPFDQGPFYVNTKAKTWTTAPEKPLTAAVSSLGIGGTNVHMILAEPPQAEQTKTSRSNHLIRFSASSPEALEAYEAKLLDYLKQYPALNLANVAFTLQMGRKSLGYRKYLSVESTEQLIDQLGARALKTHELAQKKNIVFMFSGQGSQYFNMGYGLYKGHPFFRDTMDQGFAQLEALTGFNYKTILFKEAASAGKINQTEFTQPILFLLEYSLAQLLIKYRIIPSYLTGHSLGEYVAACLSGVFTLDDALKIVCKRAELMSKAPHGAMLSVGLPLEQLEDALIEKVSIAAINSPNSTVLSGEKEEIEAVKSKLDEREIHSVVLKTSHAFHSDSMQAIIEPFAEALEKVEFSAPKIPFVSNTTGQLITDEQATSIEYWKNHILETVHFQKGIRQLIQSDNTIFIEVGPGKTLTTFYRQCQDLTLNNAVFNTIRHPKEKMDDEQHFNQFLGFLWSNGIDIDWEAYYQNERRLKVPLPTYVFDSFRLPTKVSAQKLLSENDLMNAASKDIAEGLFLPSWKYSPSAAQASSATDLGKDCLLFSDRSALADAVKQKLLKQQINVIEVALEDSYEKIDDSHYSIKPTSIKDLEQLTEELAQGGFGYDLIVYCDPPASGAQIDFDKALYKNLISGFEALLNMVRVLPIRASDTPKKLVFITQNSCVVTGQESSTALNSYVQTFSRTLSQEFPHLDTCTIDVLPEEADEKLASEILKELNRKERNLNIAFRHHRRWTRYFEKISVNDEIPTAQLRVKGNYLITSASSNIEFAIASYLLQAYQARVILLTEDMKSGQNGANTSFNPMETLFKGLKKLPGEIHFITCDVADRDRFSSEIAQVENQFGPLHAVFHTAKYAAMDGLLPLDSLTENMIHKHFTPRLEGILNLYEVFGDRDNVIVKVVSSLSSFLGGIAYGAYAAASSLMDEFVLSKCDQLNNWSILNLDRITQEEDKGEWISHDELARAIEYASFLNELPQIVVSKRGLHTKQAIAPKAEVKEQAAAVNRTGLKTTFKAATSETEALILSFFENLFGLSGIGIEDDFFDLGGDSLKGMTLINKIDKSFHIKLSISEIFEHPSITALSNLVDEKLWLSEEKLMANELLI